ncbi:MAG: DNA gyrase inhibitor YacG [Planctomycetes bacterium]|nr:DNA gyrase inhibitor YacG [Planctomycetota bacterium]MBL7106231.1 DNA gyrase inhibitor YacG [Phycisphaerae bacterium]
MKCLCPTCKKALCYHPEKKGELPQFFPFCSERCRLIDLGAWLEADYKITSKEAKNGNQQEE